MFILRETHNAGASILFEIKFVAGAVVISDSENLMNNYITIAKNNSGYNFAITNKHTTNTIEISIQKVI